MLSTEIEKRQNRVTELKEQLKLEQQKVNEMKTAETSLLEAESHLKQAIAKTDNLPQWLKEKFWETFKAEVKDVLLEGDRSSSPEFDNGFHFLQFALNEIVRNHKRIEWEFGKGDSVIHPFLPGDVNFDSNKGTWHLEIDLGGEKICKHGITITMLSITPTAEERMPSVQWMGKFKNWTWGIDIKSVFHKSLTEEDSSLITFMSNVAELYSGYKRDCLATIEKKQIIKLDDLQSQFALSNKAFQCILEDLYQSDEAAFLDANQSLLWIDDDEFNFNNVATVCYKNKILSNSQIEWELLEPPLIKGFDEVAVYKDYNICLNRTGGKDYQTIMIFGGKKVLESTVAMFTSEKEAIALAKTKIDDLAATAKEWEPSDNLLKYVWAKVCKEEFSVKQAANEYGEALTHEEIWAEIEEEVIQWLNFAIKTVEYHNLSSAQVEIITKLMREKNLNKENTDNPLKIQVVPGKGIKWEEDDLPRAFSHSDFINKKLNLSDYKRDTLKAIASYMGLSAKGKKKEDIWERIRIEYLYLCNKVPNQGVTNFEAMKNEA
jgi:hypothetical protein